MGVGVAGLGEVVGVIGVEGVRVVGREDAAIAGGGYLNSQSVEICLLCMGEVKS